MLGLAPKGIMQESQENGFMVGNISRHAVLNRLIMPLCCNMPLLQKLLF